MGGKSEVTQLLKDVKKLEDDMIEEAKKREVVDHGAGDDDLNLNLLFPITGNTPVGGGFFGRKKSSGLGPNGQDLASIIQDRIGTHVPVDLVIR